ncbi:uncharacterized protein CcaverHIS019_0503840 [Cutaneotrichosporon cavernicola]|uniref:MFS general substrate transporter n=1 Tax=Cutaneotrichosporon cavernicola TaxID=279322 RepID=A0AA48L6C6_9TREE|nr:uncharacterized protein CcaverHIS019_0503840 [Cutaneotrichosporon cavernicola]BEI92756.1 hypothetical protein CcaverHIS019_0503840 [Cutaneotrichosporon cavernicola]
METNFSPPTRTQSPTVMAALSRVSSLVANPPLDIHRNSPNTPRPLTELGDKMVTELEYTTHHPDTPSAASTVAPDGCTEVKELDGDTVHIPDGGLRAWLVVLGACHILFSTFGFVRTGSGWIGSLQYMLIYLPALPMGRLVDRGLFLYPFWIASALYPLAIILTAEVKEYWQATLCHGVLFGFMAGILFCPAIAVTSQWFHHKRALALGVVACASSLGGTIFPIITTNCLKHLGFPWTMRICGFICLYSTIFASLTLRNCLPPKNAAGGMFNLKAFKNPAYSFFTIGCFLVMGGLYTPLSFMDVMGKEMGLGTYASYLITIANAFSTIGRIGPALVADKVGSMNILIPGLFGSIITTFGWPFAHNKAGITAIAATNGIFQGSFVSLLAPACAVLGNVEDIGRRFGMVNTLMSFGAFLAAPASGALLSKTDFHAVSYYAASLLIGGTACFILARHYHLRKFWGKM